MTIDLGDIDTPIYIEYKVNLNKAVSTSGTTEWENVGIMNWNGGSSAHTTAVVRHGGSGTEIGYNGSVELRKIDAVTKKALAGAVFDLENQSGKVLQANLTTDSNGNLIVKNLKDGNYQFVEVKAPQGYQINSKPIQFTINDSSSNAVSVKVTAENQPLKSSSSKISGSRKSSSSSKKLNSRVTASSSKKSSSIKSSSSLNRVSSKQSSGIKGSSSEALRSKSGSSSNSLVILTSSIKKNGSKSHRGVPGWSKNSSSNLRLSQKSSGLKNSIETSSKQGHFSIPNAKPSIESSEVPVEANSQKATLVSSTIVVPVPEQGSSSQWTMSSKATLVSRTKNVPTVSSPIVIVSKPNGTSNSANDNHGSNSSSAPDGTDNRSSKPTLVSNAVNNDNLNEDNEASSRRSNQPSSSNVPAFQKAAVKSSSSSEVKKNGKILPQTGEEKELMDVLSIVGLIMVGSVVGIEISKHRHN